MTHHFHRIKKIALEHHRAAVESFHVTHRHAKRLLRKHKVTLRKIRKHALKSTAIAGASMSVLAGPALAANAPTPVQPETGPQDLQHQLINDHVKTAGEAVTAVATTQKVGPSKSLANKQAELATQIKQISPQWTDLLTGDQETQFSQLIQQQYGIKAVAELEGMRLNATQGIIAGEQHLRTYDGDTLANHQTDPLAYSSGMVPGTPSWGIPAASASQVTQLMREQEEYYSVVQTWLSPGWTPQKNVWFKNRKLLMMHVDEKSHKVYAVVTDILDAGPNPRLTSVVDGQVGYRKYGGSPETIIGLGLGLERVGHVFAFFIDDPNNTVPLGPVGVQ